MEYAGSDGIRARTEGELNRTLRLTFLILILIAVPAVHYRNQIGSGLLYAKHRLMPERPAAGVPSAAVVNPWAKIKLTPFLSGFKFPVYLTNAGDGSGRIFVVEKAGLIRVIKDGKISDEPFLDIVDRVRSSDSETGLLSVAFHPDYKVNGRFFVNYTDHAGDTIVSEFHAGEDHDRGDPSSGRVIMKIKQPARNHNGGQLQFGPDGYLYTAMGDGGFFGDPSGNGQNMDTLLAKMLRIDVDGGKPYRIPEDNPFRGKPGVRPEIWAYGLRNPWRFSFDSLTGDMYIADVGEGKWEEVDFQPHGDRGGENYGWSLLEGSYKFKLPDGYDTAGITFPVVEYSHDEGCSVTGGYVYRGKINPGIRGTYLFSDFCSGKLWGLRKKPDGSWEWAKFLDTGLSVSSFGEDESGELYILDLAKGGIYRIAEES